MNLALNQPNAKALDRERALNAKPEKLPRIDAQEDGQNGLKVTVLLEPPAWSRWFGASGHIKRTFQLDYLGREVYEACDGKTTVKALIRSFSNRHGIDLAEAEVSMTSYLQTLMRKGLIAMAVSKQGSSGKHS
jgi:hypothetical protein